MRGDNIVLIGMMGSGKSSVGEALSRTLGWDFIDMDRTIEEREGTSISDIFAVKGEDYFRGLETELLKNFKGKHVIIATGGGVLEREENFKLLDDIGTVIYLYAPAQELYRRIRKQTHRPLMGDEDSFCELLNRRTPMYERAAHFEISTDRRRYPEIVEEIYEKING